jgi:hypothetical protein
MEVISSFFAILSAAIRVQLKQLQMFSTRALKSKRQKLLTKGSLIMIVLGAISKSKVKNKPTLSIQRTI